MKTLIALLSAWWNPARAEGTGLFVLAFVDEPTGTRHNGAVKTGVDGRGSS